MASVAEHGECTIPLGFGSMMQLSAVIASCLSVTDGDHLMAAGTEMAFIHIGRASIIL